MSCATFTEFRHAHDIHNQAGPAGEMLCPLPLAGLGIVLLPRKARPFPLPKHIFNQVDSELGIDLSRLLLMRAFGGRNSLQKNGQSEKSGDTREMVLVTSRFFTIR